MARTCPSCGTTLPSEYRYCLNCGRDGGAVTEVVEAHPPTLVYQGTPPGGSNTPAAQITDTPKKSILPWVLVGACLVIIGFLATLLLGPFKQNEGVTTQNVATPTPTPVSTPTPTSAFNDPNTSQAKATPTPSNDTKVLRPSPSPSQSSKDENRIYRPSEVDEMARILSKPSATYTEEARANNIQGTVVLRVVLMADGSVGSIQVVKGLPHGLTARAIAAARQLKFTRATKNGREVSMSTTVEYPFNIY